MNKSNSLFIYIIIAYWFFYATITSYRKMWWYINRLLIIDIVFLSFFIILFLIVINKFNKSDSVYLVNISIFLNSTWIMYWWNSLNWNGNLLLLYALISSIISVFCNNLILKDNRLDAKKLLKDILFTFIIGVIMIIITYIVLFLSFLY